MSFCAERARAVIAVMEFLTPNAVKSLAFAAVQGLGAVALAGALISCGRRLTAADKGVMLWVSYSMIVHYTLVKEGLGGACLSFS